MTLNRLAITVLAIALLFDEGKEKSRQPIAYNHKKHLQMQLDCSLCHTGLTVDSIRAGKPQAETCAMCHQPDSPITQSPEEKKLLSYIEKNQPIPWIQVNKLPDTVYFSHRRHFTIEKIPCAQCHGKMEEMIRPPEKPFVPLKMKWCITCHQEQNASVDCNACHK